MQVITIAPAANGWSVAVAGVANAMMFRSGALAEDAARRLAQRLADAGQDAKIQYQLRDGSRGPRFAYPARSWRSAVEAGQPLSVAA